MTDQTPSNGGKIDTGKRVILHEAAAMTILAENLSDSFDRAVELMRKAPGRVIVSGMGKSGHIARKIAATLASTGTPAHFVHPAEASHGDLGMITQADVVLVLSNSGETPELADLIAHTRRYSIPMIGIASKPGSSLMTQSDVGLLLPPATEACGTGIVPTTSTTMSLALGDALAVALMEHRDFTAENFRDFHPGGKLGAKLSMVMDLMHGPEALPLVPRDAEMGEVLITISQKGFGVAGVVDDQGALLGIITDGDLRRNLDGLMEKTASDVMTIDPKTVRPRALGERALGIMNNRGITCLFVVPINGPKVPVGLIHIHDCLRAGIE